MRRSVQTKVDQFVVATGLCRVRHTRWICGHSRNIKPQQQLTRIAAEPARMTRLAHNGAGEVLPQQLQELHDGLSLELQARRELEKYGPQLISEEMCLREEILQRVS